MAKSYSDVLRGAAATCAAGVVLMLILVAANPDAGRQSFTETGILQSTDSTFLRAGYDADCMIYGTFGGASVDVETRVENTQDVKDVNVAALLAATADTAWTPIRLGWGEYRLEVTGGDATTTLTFHCRSVDP